MASPEARMTPATHTQGQQAGIQPHTQKAKAREGWAQPRTSSWEGVWHQAEQGPRPFLGG